MGNLSEHFSNRDFVCRCGQCGSQYRIHLGLVGALELIGEHFRKLPRILDAFRCEFYNEKHNITKKNSHRQGKAAHIRLDGVSLKDLFKFVETIPEIRGIGVHPSEKFLHIDTRTADKDSEKEMWVNEGGKILPLTHELRTKYDLL